MGTTPIETISGPTRMWENLSPDRWNSLVDLLKSEYPNGGVEGILPPHFLKSTFRKIGGQIAHLEKGNASFWGIFLPGSHKEGHEWTMRAHFRNASQEFKEEVESGLVIDLYNLGYGSGTWYDVERKRTAGFFGQPLSNFGEYQFAYPSKSQAQQAQSLQNDIWKTTDPAYLYPYDLYQPDAGLSTRLVATLDNKVIGFLFGFYGRGDQWFAGSEEKDIWIESQLMGIREDQRKKGVGKQLKFFQRELALQEGIKEIHWTFDPLQAVNALLNFNQLGGFAGHFYENYYPFQNDLNRVRASRVGVTWVLSSDRVNAAGTGRLYVPDYSHLRSRKDTEVLIPINIHGQHIEHFYTYQWNPKGNILLIQIPTNWTDMQRDHIDIAQSWRQATDAIFAKILGTSEEKYALTGIVKHPEIGSTFLVAEKSPQQFAYHS